MCNLLKVCKLGELFVRQPPIKTSSCNMLWESPFDMQLHGINFKGLTGYSVARLLLPKSTVPALPTFFNASAASQTTNVGDIALPGRQQ